MLITFDTEEADEVIAALVSPVLHRFQVLVDGVRVQADHHDPAADRQQRQHDNHQRRPECNIFA